ncbi:uncharacterized protein AMSG_06429 [Thecamonas trahens ATCC 50062]|uniref:WD repeat domain 65 n=1 Tax=Thecamonas trahens ATCC 50062 TaxID=461836 RepID=A0A0L0DDH3_THETB|nr:hypothetical protein AMSG_06429 [Thecamonas trahens ATCC 50062]KNC50270.1 hypothetical protein AMSG_06429 [Thecamonas trahens ATCC 50062]|eukprot:XP_013757097.1 hypothetical protein AMSG_06429 [Thecamonas trahens ATCC 50062]
MVYPAGRRVVVADRAAVEFVATDHAVRTMGCLALAPDRKHLAAAELDAGGRAQISVYNLSTNRRERVLRVPDVDAITTLAFSSDSRYLVAVGAEPESKLVIASINLHTSVLRVAFSPFDTNTVLVVGGQYLRLWRLAHDELHSLLPVVTPSLQASPGAVNTDAAWFHGDAFCVANDRGELVVYEAGEATRLLPDVFPTGISTVVPYRNGVLVASTTKAFKLYEENLETGELELRKSLVCSLDSSRYDDVPLWMAVSPTGSEVAVVLSSSQVLCIAMSGLDLSSPEMSPEEEDSSFALLASGFHSGAILDVDCAIRKPLLVTAGADRTLRVWHYIDMQCTNSIRFRDEPLAVAFHPLGLHVLVAFSEGVSMLAVLASGFRVDHVFKVKFAKVLRFSTNGAYFAAASGATILLFSSTTLSLVGKLDGHVRPVANLAFLANDMMLASAAGDGAIYYWDLVTMTRASVASSLVFKDVAFHDIVALRTVPRREADADADADLAVHGTWGAGNSIAATQVVVTGNDRIVRLCDAQRVVSEHRPGHFGMTSLATSVFTYERTTRLEGGGVALLQDELARGDDADVVHDGSSTELALHGQRLDTPLTAVGEVVKESLTAHLVFGASSDGKIRIFDAPYSMMDPVSMQLHSGGVNKLVVSPDNNLLISVGATGCIFLSAIRPVVDGKVRPRRLPVPERFSDLLLTTTNAFQELLNSVFTLEKRLADSANAAEYQLQAEARKAEQHLANMLQEERKRELDQREMYAELQAIHESRVRQFNAEKRKQEEEHGRELRALVEKHGREMARQKELLARVREEYDEALTDAEDKSLHLEEEHKAVLVRMRQDYEANLATQLAAFDKLVEELELNDLEHAEILRQVAEDHDDEVMEMKKVQEVIKTAASEKTVQLTDDRALLKMQYTDAVKERDALAAENARLHTRADTLRGEITELERRLSLLRVSVHERDEIIADKEMRILETKKLNQDLEKYKFVLDFKNKELTKQLEPKEQALVEMAQRLNSMDEELQRNVKEVDNLSLIIKEKDKKMAIVQRDAANMHRALKARIRVQEAMEKDLHQLYTKADQSQWREGIRHMYEAYVSKEARDSLDFTGEDSRLEEFGRQRLFMEQTIERLRSQQQSTISLKTSEVSRRAKENHFLIVEINDLRRENKHLVKQLRALRAAAGVPPAGSTTAGGSSSSRASGPRASPAQGDQARNDQARERVLAFAAGSSPSQSRTRQGSARPGSASAQPARSPSVADVLEAVSRPRSISPFGSPAGRPAARPATAAAGRKRRGPSSPLMGSSRGLTRRKSRKH